MLTSKEQVQRARILRANATPTERLLWLHLKGKQLKGLKFRRQCPFGTYFADFACLSARLIVELDGEQHEEPKAVKYDRIRTMWLRDQKFRVLRFKNKEVKREMPMVLATIAHAAMNPDYCTDD
jgi:very-short-patch-repair endonuclease